MTSANPAPKTIGANDVLDVAIIGAGIAGCAAARQLLANGRRIVVYDRGRQAGGRASSNRAGFDYGVPAFEADSPVFLERVHQWQPRAKRWVADQKTVDDLPDVEGPNQWIASESFAGVIAAELGKVDCQHDTIIESIDYQDGHWSLTDAQGDSVGHAHRVLLAMPVEQARRLLAAHTQQAMLPIDRPTKPMSVPQWVAMLEFEEPVSTSTDFIVFDEHPVLAAAWSEARKPGGSGAKWIIHSSPVWAQIRLNTERQSIAEQMFAAFRQAVGSCPLIMSHRAHRWTFSRVREPLGSLGKGPLTNQQPPITLCGDWSLNGSIQGAWLSGRAAAEKMETQL